MRRLFSIGAICTAMFAFVLTGCNPDKTFTVTFDSQGGSVVSPIEKVENGSIIAKPTDPTQDGFEFAGWYKETACTNAWNFSSDVVTSNITLYAKWSQGFIINAQVANGATYNAFVDEVRAISGMSVEAPAPEGWDVDVDGPYYEYQEVILATAPYQNGGFKMILPAQFDERLLYSMADDGEIPDGLTISDPNVKVCTVDYFGAYKNGEYVDDLVQMSINMLTFELVMINYMFVDRDLRITGTIEEEGPMVYDINMKQGWNAAFISMNMMTGAGKITTTLPAVMPLWMFQSDLPVDYKPQKAPQKMFKKKF